MKNQSCLPIWTGAYLLLMVLKQVIGPHGEVFADSLDPDTNRN